MKYKTKITLEITFDGDTTDDPALWNYETLFDLGDGESVRVVQSDTERAGD